MIVNISKHAATEWSVLQIIEQAVDLVEFALFVLMFDAKLIAVRFADATIWVGPLVPNVRIKIIDVVGFFLPNPKNFVDR